MFGTDTSFVNVGNIKGPKGDLPRRTWSKGLGPGKKVKKR